MSELTGRAIDVSYGAATLELERVTAAGVESVGRYLGGGARITRDELARLEGAGLGVFVIWETTITRALEGGPAGVADADAASRELDALGWPADGPVYFACDTDPRQNRRGVVDYYHSAATELRRVGGRPCGGYVGDDPGAELLATGILTFWWQPNARAWSTRWPHPAAQLVQLLTHPYNVGAAYDADVVQHRPYGAVGLAGPPARKRAPMALVGRHTPDNTPITPWNSTWYAISGGLLTHELGGDPVGAYAIPAEAQGMRDDGCPFVPLSDGDVAMLKLRSGWKD